MAVQFIEGGVEQHLPMFNHFLKSKAPALDIGLAQMNGDGRHIADLLGQKYPAGNHYGTESKKNGAPIPFHCRYSH